MKKSYDPSGNISPTDFYFMLRNCKEDCLVKAGNNGGKISFHGQLPDQDEEFSPTIESDVVADWLEALGGSKLVEQVLRIFAKDLETETLVDLRQRISDMLEFLQEETGQLAAGKGVGVSPPDTNNSNNSSQIQGSRNYVNLRGGHGKGQECSSGSHSTISRVSCKLCLATSSSATDSHSIGNCPLLSSVEKKDVVPSVL